MEEQQNIGKLAGRLEREAEIIKIIPTILHWHCDEGEIAVIMRDIKEQIKEQGQ